VLFYLIVLYGCVCQPLINGYDDDDDGCNHQRTYINLCDYQIQVD